MCPQALVTWNRRSQYRISRRSTLCVTSMPVLEMIVSGKRERVILPAGFVEQRNHHLPSLMCESCWCSEISVSHYFLYHMHSLCQMLSTGGRCSSYLSFSFSPVEVGSLESQLWLGLHILETSCVVGSLCPHVLDAHLPLSWFARLFGRIHPPVTSW